MNKPLIIAMDFKDKQSANAFLTSFGNEKLFLKVGMELFYREGPALVEEWKEVGHQLFLDLKLHDIPNTVKAAAKQLASLQVDLMTVHASGGIKMMEAAREGLVSGANNKTPDCIAVTQLTSTSEKMMKNELAIEKSLQDTVIHYAANAKQAGLQGVVCSAHEAPFIKQHVSSDFACVTPGIRLSNNSADDQKRVVTPGEASELGSDAIVVGRSITRADSPYQQYNEMKKQWRNET
ncbi:orotidine-5'-phosphate decarboxylase [Alteribacillus sp. YIM 98480]|uniref:orotidine-5'-phosphate decarboxylase n=1 Tax=Alteribacillus sp. YIM 98480 TaxID=2606599 RepID=UPI00131AD218|nr:orotidine-5'-phosphate decarboxylase [Alteribacillus sp. YIM 98480]